MAWSLPSYALGVQVVETWMDLESVIQSEVSQKEKNKYCILMHMAESRKMVREPICRVEIETQM